jgi:hypothetical protein
LLPSTADLTTGCNFVGSKIRCGWELSSHIVVASIADSLNLRYSWCKECEKNRKCELERLRRLENILNILPENIEIISDISDIPDKGLITWKWSFSTCFCQDKNCKGENHIFL